MKLLHVYQSPSFSGAEAYAVEVAEHHAMAKDEAGRALNEVTFLVKKEAPLHQKIKSLKTTISDGIFVSTSFGELDPLNFDAIILHSTQELKRHWPALALSKLKAKISGRKAPKVILYTHIWISHSKVDPLHALSYSVLDRVWCSSQASKKTLEQHLPIASKRIDVVRYGRRTDLFLENLQSKSQARAKLAIPDDALVVGTMSRVDEGKGSRELFEAVTDLMQSRSDVHFLMIGPPTDGDPKASDLDRELTEAVNRMSLVIRSRIHKIGRLEAGSTYLSAFDLFVLATYKENFALTLIESLLAKVPCLATDSGGSPDVIRPHTTGWLFLPGSTDSLRSTLLTAIDQKEKWAEFGNNGHHLVLENFNFETVMRDLDQKLRAL